MDKFPLRRFSFSFCSCTINPDIWMSWSTRWSRKRGRRRRGDKDGREVIDNFLSSWDDNRITSEEFDKIEVVKEEDEDATDNVDEIELEEEDRDKAEEEEEEEDADNNCCCCCCCGCCCGGSWAPCKSKNCSTSLVSLKLPCSFESGSCTVRSRTRACANLKGV